MNFLILAVLSLSMIFIFMSHPLAMLMILIIQALMIGMVTGIMNYNFWFSYIMFIIFVGAMLVIFIYMTSIASNEKIKFNWIMLLLPFSLSLFWFFFKTDCMMYNNSIYMTLFKFFSLPTNSLIYMLIIYLLITLIASVKISAFKQGPLRQKI
uniref:NADH dehydrogenase subunit 6 n=1 Tax=Euspilotus scissus TaxID=694456 RepID=D8WKP7_9COLE|nr:NADH dehydrogenase subunit 6 [Euspilotus scissus]ACZ58580.1 NADH dehydrogenase subunit 6 [Euspilotus scissus]